MKRKFNKSGRRKQCRNPQLPTATDQHLELKIQSLHTPDLQLIQELNKKYTVPSSHPRSFSHNHRFNLLRGFPSTNSPPRIITTNLVHPVQMQVYPPPYSYSNVPPVHVPDRAYLVARNTTPAATPDPQPHLRSQKNLTGGISIISSKYCQAAPPPISGSWHMTTPRRQRKLRRSVPRVQDMSVSC